MGTVWACYTAKFKLEIVHCAQELGNRAARKEFDVDESNVRWWLCDKEKL
jgi:transposase-like protein